MILITGATGHIGNVLTRQLIERGEHVRVLVLPNESTSLLGTDEIEVVRGDVLQRESLVPAFSGVDVVYHLAAMISIMPGKNEYVRRVNLEGTRNVLWTARQASVRRLVYTSSIHAITRAPHGSVINESLPFDTHNPVGTYDRSKAEASLEVLEAANQGMDAVIVCPTGVIGPYDFRRSEMGQLILDCVLRKPQLYVDGAYDFVDVRDVVQGHILAGTLGQRGQVYILSGEAISVANMLETLEQVIGERISRYKVPLGLARFAAIFAPYYYHLTNTKPRFTPYSLETLQSNCNISSAKARQDLGYATRPLRDTLADTVAWFRQYSTAN